MFESRIPSSNLRTQVTQEIIRYIRGMDLHKDNKLPREEEFCKIIGTSRVTLRAALDELAAHGVIFRKHGKGTFANPCSMDIKVSFSPVLDFYSMIMLSGYTPSMELLGGELIEAPADLPEQMLLKPRQKMWVSRKIFFADNQFCAYVEDFLNVDLLGDAQKIEACTFDSSLFPLLEKEFGVRIDWDKVEIDTICSAQIPALAKLVREQRCKDGALLLLRGVSYDTAERPVLYAREYIDTGVIRFNQIRKRQSAL